MQQFNEPGFNEYTTAEEVVRGIDLHGATALVTGASGGIGLETARVLARAGATVVLAARDLKKNRRAIETIRSELPHAQLDAVELDLSDLRSVRHCAQTVLQRHPRLTLLINNAGVMASPLERTAEGCEMQFGTNHLGHFLLTNLLMPALLRGAPSRIVIVSSAGHRFADVDFDDPHYERKPYEKWQAYGQSKTANCLFAAGLAARIDPAQVTANAVHPGRIQTDLRRHLDDAEVTRMKSNKSSESMKSTGQGAATQVWAATSPALAGVSGKYLLDCRIGDPAHLHGEHPDYQRYALDTASAERLWTLSEALVGERFATPDTA